MKNKNMVRTVHPVKRVVVFDWKDDAKRFIDLYSDLFYRAKDKAAWNHKGYRLGKCYAAWELSFTIKKSDFDEIVKNLELEKLNKGTADWYYKD